MASMERPGSIHAAGRYTTIGAVYADVAPPANVAKNWTGARTGIGTATITLQPGSEVDPTQRVVLATSGTTLNNAIEVAGTNNTVLFEQRVASTAAAAEGIVNFLVVRVAG